MDKKSQGETTKNSDREILLINTTLSLAGEIGWPLITLKMISEQTSMPFDEVSVRYKSKWEILDAFRKRIDSSITSRTNNNWPQQPIRDRFFDVVMERIEIIDPWKAGIISISKDCATRPLAGIYLFSRLRKSMDKMVGHVGAKLRGPKRLAQSHGLTIIYLLVLRRWMLDETADLGPTMAELNERLIFADKVVTQLCFSRRKDTNPS